MRNTQKEYGRRISGNEMFFTKTNYMKKNPDLMPCDRRPTKKK
eukprot:CAMPEP_0201281446 /NCGR_PEP_ID=MMETSP1317-20130820/2751_1 /ASSEMBLY_ACC=CAM_ASM_000770 /TAXON_ID=187299 /ORGANISM="Undescribed Undescribed, Strain Undescribed" /LENGTH=42 /DNA_ID= /DNA_START= /DNA_END= /DNA_ORIENTATION=